MTWQLGAFAVLGLALAAGFAWYERAHPDARVVALVATLAAFAALGRIAFAALPNVKPTTDIVLIAGYTLGGGPGFAVGAIAGLTSNFFFGQGPWTPWQMAAWGVTGMLGAGLALATRQRISRWPLALVCCGVGFLFTVVQDVGDWVTYSDHSLAQLATYVGTGLGFDAIDAAGCLVFALAFGPALLHSIQRFTRRLHVVWRSPPGVLAPLLIVTLGTLGGLGVLGARAPVAHAAAGQGRHVIDAPRAAGSATGYLLSAQNADGGFGAATGQPSSPLFSAWAALGLASEGHDPADISRDGHSLLAYLKATVTRYPGSLERTILAVRAAGRPVTDIGGRNLVEELLHQVRRNGSVADQVNLTTFAILALRAAGAPLPGRMLPWLIHQQDSGGGFSFATAGDEADVDDTGAALEALAGQAPAAARRAVAYLRAAQNGDGGFPSEPGEDSNAQSTAWAVQGLIAAGVDPSSVHKRGSRSPVGYLSSLVTASGAIDYARGMLQTPVWVTGEALMALAGKPLPLAPATSARGPGGLSSGGRRFGHGKHRPGHRPVARRRSDRAQRRARHRVRAHASRHAYRSFDLTAALLAAGLTISLLLALAGSA